MADQKISQQSEKTSLANDDLFVIVDSVTGLNRKVKSSRRLLDGEGSTITGGNKVDVGGTALEFVQIQIAKDKGFSFHTGDPADQHNLLLHPALMELKYRKLSETLFTILRTIRLSVPTRNVGGMYLFVTNGSDLETDGTKAAGIALLKDGTIDVGELHTNTGRFSHMQFKHDYSATWNALAAAIKNRVIPDIEWINNNGNATININNAGVLALNTTPKAVKAAGGTNIILIPQQVTIRHNFVTGAFATNTTLQIGIGSVYVDLTTTVLTSGSTQIDIEDISGLFTNISANQPINVKVKTGDPTAGGGTLDVWITYKTLDIS